MKFSVLSSKLLKKFFKSKMKARTVNAGLFMAFKYHISFATDFVANFGCDLFRIIPEIVEKNLESEQTPFFLDRLSILMKFDLMFCTGLDLQNVFYSYAFFFTQRPIINDRKIEQSNECCYVQ